MRTNWWAAVLAALLPVPLAAQSLAQRVQGAGDGTVRLSFASRAGVCSRGPGSITILDDTDENEEWEGECERGPVRVSLRVRDGRVTGSETYVGGRWRPGRGRVTDLGLVPAQQAADLLLGLAPQVADDDGGELVTAATLADSVVVWPELLRMARDTQVREETRRQAVFWLGQAAGQAATSGLDSLATDGGGDVEIRKHAVFALSQRPDEEGVPVLIRIARSNRHPEIRKTALFWLGQSEDPRALTLFEELLR
ncbi:MAG: HEAT repeat domain-containing protein [Gemmatimonadales bacterium]